MLPNLKPGIIIHFKNKPSVCCSEVSALHVKRELEKLQQTIANQKSIDRKICKYHVQVKA